MSKKKKKQFRDFESSDYENDFKEPYVAITKSMMLSENGLRTELKKLSEEVYELQEVIFDYEHFLEQIPNRTLIAKEVEKSLKEFDKIEEENIELRKHLIEEYSDVCLILEQIKVFFELDNDHIIKIMEQKLNRQMTRIAKEKE